MAIDHENDPQAAQREAVRNWLIEFRRRRGLTQRQLANRLQMGRATIDRWESGKSWPTPAHCQILAVLGRDVHMPAFPPTPGREG